MAPDAAMGRLGPCLLALLVSLGASFVGSGGEICLNWTEGPESPTGAFQCPAKLDSADATFCCGPCSAPYCCSSTEIRLDQDQCPGGDQLIVSSVPPAIPDSLYSFYIALGLTAFVISSCIAYIIYHEICLPLRARIRARLQVHEQATAPSRVSFQDPSPTFTYNVASRLRGRNPPPLYHTCTVVQLSSLLPLDNRDPHLFSHTDTPAQPSQADSETPGDDVASSSSAALLDTAASDGSSKPEEYTTSPKQMGAIVPDSIG